MRERSTEEIRREKRARKGHVPLHGLFPLLLLFPSLSVFSRACGSCGRSDPSAARQRQPLPQDARERMGLAAEEGGRTADR